MEFVGHLNELRVRLIRSAIAWLLGALLAYVYWEPILNIFTGYPLHRLAVKPALIYTTASEAFMVRFKMAFFGGLVLAVPFLLYQFWRFVAPGLYVRERKLFIPLLFFSTLAFLGGMTFCYYVVLPLAFAFLLDFYSVGLTPMLTIGDYLSFNVKMMAAFGVVFEMPVLAFVLTRMGLLRSGFLVRHVRYAVVIIFIVAAVLTPPDVLSQTLMALPLLLLYGLSIGIAHFAGGRRV